MENPIRNWWFDGISWEIPLEIDDLGIHICFSCNLSLFRRDTQDPHQQFWAGASSHETWTNMARFLKNWTWCWGVKHGYNITYLESLYIYYRLYWIILYYVVLYYVCVMLCYIIYPYHTMPYYIMLYCIYVGAEEHCSERPRYKCTKQWRETFFLFFTVESVAFWMPWQLERDSCWRSYGLQYLLVFQVHPEALKKWGLWRSCPES